MESLLNRPSKNQNYDNSALDYDQEPSEEDKIAKAVKKALDAERSRQEQENIRKEQAEFPQKLVQAFPDFDNVCTTENLDYFEFHYPEAAAPFKNLPDSFDKWSKIYRAVKRFVPTPNSKKDQAKAEKNFNKPQAMAAGGVTSTGDTAPMDVTQAKRDANWNRMQRVMRSVKLVNQKKTQWLNL